MKGRAGGQVEELLSTITEEEEEEEDLGLIIIDKNKRKRSQIDWGKRDKSISSSSWNCCQRVTRKFSGTFLNLVLNLMRPANVVVVVTFLFALSGSLHLCACAGQRYNALFNFGDSFSDTGNVKISTLPYGMTYFHRFTGRCSDGRLIIDFIAEGIGLPHLPPNSEKNQSFQQGVNFATTAALALDFEFFLARNMTKNLWVRADINRQINNLEMLFPSICGSPQDCKDFLSKSLFVLGVFGGNDYSTGFFNGRSFDEVITFAPHVVKAVSDGVERLIGLGARDIIVPNVLPSGCFPLYLALWGSDKAEDYGQQTGCMKQHNLLSWHHNLLLRRALDKLRPKYPSVLLRLADYYSQTMEIVLNPLKYGFSAGALRTCCGGPGKGPYNFNLMLRCAAKANFTVCEDPATHVSWDGVHFTEAANRVVADGWLHGPYIDPPILN